MLYAGLDLSRQRLDVHVMDEEGSTIEVTAVHPDLDALRTLATGSRVAALEPGGELLAVLEMRQGRRLRPLRVLRSVAPPG